jgi:hypothetical protein
MPLAPPRAPHRATREASRAFQEEAATSASQIAELTKRVEAAEAASKALREQNEQLTADKAQLQSALQKSDGAVPHPAPLNAKKTMYDSNDGAQMILRAPRRCW